MYYRQQQGLYSPEDEHDACGVGLVLQIDGKRSHEIVERGLQVLENMMHRGAESADNKTGDGAGIMIQIPHEFILLQGIEVPERGLYGTGLVFLPKQQVEADACLRTIREKLTAEGLALLHVRDVPVNSDILGEISRGNEPQIKQIFVTQDHEADRAASDRMSQNELELKLYIARKKIEKAIIGSTLQHKRDFYIVSLSTKRIIYKGMLSSIQVREYFPDLTDKRLTTAIALVHSRFSTNTMPTWDLAQPFRLLGHNGEINTIKGNRFWMTARESVLKSDRLGDMEELFPIVQPEMSDSASLDNALEFLLMSGKSLPHALAMLIPESWNAKNPISDDLKAFYEYHSIFMEPWDGPATILFSDGRYAGGLLDRNGLRPARYLITKGGMMIVASEAGVQSIDIKDIKEKGRLCPGKMLMIDTETGEIHYDAELKGDLAKAYPYRQWLERNRVDLNEISSGRKVKNSVENLNRLLYTFGYSKEDADMLIAPMASNGQEPSNSMGNDTPLAAFSEKPQRVFAYFRQLFAQVTNPPIDPIREKLVMSLTGYIGSLQKNMLDEIPEHCKVVKLHSPILSNRECDLLKNLHYKGFTTEVLPMLFRVSEGKNGMLEAVKELCEKAKKAVDKGVSYIILSDRGVDEDNAPIPSLLATSAVHHYLIEKRKRMQIDLVVETGEPRENMHFALLTGFGANAINPYLVFAVIEKQIADGNMRIDYASAEKHYIDAVNKGLLKVMSKMGISTIRSYRGAQIFEAVGLNDDVIDKYFKGTVSKIGGADLGNIAKDAMQFHHMGWNDDEFADIDALTMNNGMYKYRRTGEKHAWSPEVIAKLQIATKTNNYKMFKEFCGLVDKNEQKIFIRDFFDIKKSKKSISIDDVEPASAIMKRFCTGAMSFGAISEEAHEAIAIAMNSIGARSNTGEGGEDSERFKPQPKDHNTRSAIKQIASGRFGVTTEYLVNADELQIKIAQGAKPGEGGQLPGFKVNEIIAKTRHSIPGISLISPPPHHDIYSIEDLAQLIFDLKNVNPRAKISVKLVSESGVGTIAAGVAKAKADEILISGAEGGTGATPISSPRHAGLPVEIGLCEIQQVLVMNGLRGQVRIQADGQLKTGRDVIMMALMGAEEYGFATVVLIVLGCVMMRKCHLNTCPHGVATQDPDLRKRFVGKSEFVVNYFNMLAQEVREYLAEMGYKSLDEIIGHTELLEPVKTVENDKEKKLDFSRLLYRPAEAQTNDTHNTKEQHHNIKHVIDQTLIKECKDAIENGIAVSAEHNIKNVDRAVGAMLSGAIALRHGEAGLKDDTVNCTFYGSAGQSFGAFLTHGTTFRLVGEANDYLGKGLSGGKIIVTPPAGFEFKAEENIIVGNTLLYGATSGEVYINGRAGERFCVRNSGATAVVEGAGDHCCEYMTGGRTVVLGKTGRNFAAGMSGGVAYVLNEDGNFDFFCNMEMVELSLIEDMSDNRELKGLIEKHLKYTGSAIAKRILNNWNEYVDKFIKVIPIEYKKVLHDEKAAAMQKKIEKVERDY